MPVSQIGFPGYGIPSGTAAIVVNNQGADYELVDDDLVGGVYVRMNVALSNTVTVPADLTMTQPVHITQTGLGTTEIVAAPGVTIQSTDGWRKTRTRYSNLTLVPIAPNTYDLIGDLAE